VLNQKNKSYQEFKNIIIKLQKSGEDYNVYPMSLEMLSDMYTPMRVMKTLKSPNSSAKHCFVLESVGEGEKFDRYTFLGYNPNPELKINSSQDGDLNERIKEVLKKYKAPKLEELPPFCGGLVGYFAYDYAKYYESSLELNAKDRCFFQDVDLMLFDKVIAFDNKHHKVTLIVNVRIDDDNNLKSEYERGYAELEKLKNLVKSIEDVQSPPQAKLKSEWNALFSKDEYCEMVEKAKHYIKEGDIFQVVLSNRFEADFEGSLFDTYRVLRGMNPSPYMFYFSGDDFEFAGASPETLVKLENGRLYTYPLAGTRKRGKDDIEDKALEKELLADEKELAEHNMLVDLGRNDLGKIAKFGSVKVNKKDYKRILRFSHVMHIGSVVSADILDSKTGLDAIGAVLPAGTLSGAPKIRAMQIIDELEGCKRGIYGGAIGYLDFTGNMDTCIAIRLAYKKGNKIFVRSGAGIVADSNPENEYQECVNKAAAVKTALEQSQGGLD